MQNSRKELTRRNFLTLVPSFCEVVKKCSFLGFLLEPFEREWPQKRKGTKNCKKSKAYLLSLVRHLYSTRLSHIYIERYIITSHV
jgi:hypothetical protein